MRVNKLGQNIGVEIDGWLIPEKLHAKPIFGKYTNLFPILNEDYAEELFHNFQLDKEQRNWTYLPYGPFDDFYNFKDWYLKLSESVDPLFFVVQDKKNQKICGMLSFLRISPQDGSAEIGHIHFSPSMQRTSLSTEAIYLMIQKIFVSGYRRCEWKCDNLNEPSKKTAVRLGFLLEGVFRQATVYKGRNRDTAWFSILDSEWETLDKAFQKWLNPQNFNPEGIQIHSLSSFTNQARKSLSI